jgi:hypothetical protein
MSVPQIKGFIYCEECNAYESLKDCTIEFSRYCVCCACNPKQVRAR